MEEEEIMFIQGLTPWTRRTPSATARRRRRRSRKVYSELAQEEEEEDLFTINGWLKVGKNNALSGNTRETESLLGNDVHTAGVACVREALVTSLLALSRTEWNPAPHGRDCLARGRGNWNFGGF